MLGHSLRFLPCLAALASLGFASRAGAQEFREPKKVSIAVERAFGINYVHTDVAGRYENSNTTLGFGFQPAMSPFHWSRLGVDVFLNEHWSLGGAVGFFKVAGDNDASGVLIAPRVGYALGLSRSISFWPRAGFSFVKPGDASLLALTLEGMFVFSPTPSWGILLGPTLDVGLTGKTGGADWSELAFSIPSAGLLGTF